MTSFSFALALLAIGCQSAEPKMIDMTYAVDEDITLNLPGNTPFTFDVVFREHMVSLPKYV